MAAKGKELVAGAPPRNKRGRPPEYPYDQDAVDEICQRIASGETLLQVCRDEHMPSEYAVRCWLLADTPANPSGFFEQYARAREMHVEHHMDRLSELARNPSLGIQRKRKQILDSHGNKIELLEEVQGDAVQRSALDIDTTKWRIARIGWRTYGARTPIADKSGDEGPEDNRIIVVGGLPDGTTEAPPPEEFDL